MFDHTCNFKIKGENLDPRGRIRIIDFGAEEVFKDDENDIAIYAPLKLWFIQAELDLEK